MTGKPDGESPRAAPGPPAGEGWSRYDPPAPAAAGGRSRAPRRRRGRVAGLVLVAVLALLLGFGAGYARGYFSAGKLGRSVTVVVPRGATLSTIARALEDKGVVKHAGAFVLRAESDGYATRFMPGTYRFRENQPYDQVVAALLKGVKPPTVKVSIPEGTTLRQASELVAAKVESIPAESYVGVARDHPPAFALQGYKPGTTLEGMLFPATYEVLPGTRAESFVKKQLSAFDGYFARVDMTRARKANLTSYDVVIIASMIDREAMAASERPLVAAVIWNRLRAGMLLQIDATVQYALGKTKPLLTYDDLKVESPYNTYLHKGLPPTPISNPGLAALQAAAHPADVTYLYYVARNDGSGRHYFSTSYSQFLKDKAKADSAGQ